MLFFLYNLLMNKIIVSNKKRVIKNIKSTSKDQTVWFLITAISAFVFTHAYFTIDWSDGNQSNIVLTEIIALPINALFIGILYSTNSFKTYLYFTAFFEFIATVLFLASRDAGQLGMTVNGASASSKAEGVVRIVALMFLTGFMIATTFVIPFIFLMTGFSFVQSITILRLKSSQLRLMLWILAQILILVIIGSILSSLSRVQDELLGHMWSDFLMKELGVSASNIENYGQIIYDVISKFLFIGWFPLFIRLNNLRKTNIFLSFSGLLVIPSIVTFMMINIDFVQVHGALLSLPIMFLAISGFSLFRYFIYFIRATMLNIRECTKTYFIPYVIHADRKQDIFVEWMVHRRIRKQERKEKQL